VPDATAQQTMARPPLPDGPFTLDSLRMVIAHKQPNAHLQRMYDFTNDAATLALTLYGEGRAETINGRAAIAWTVRNRIAGVGPRADKDKRYSDVCLRKSQYSCWWAWGGKDNFQHVMSITEGLCRQTLNGVSPVLMRVYSECQYIAVGVMNGQILDPTNGATHYCTTALFNSPQRPTWATPDKISCRIDSHVFFRGIR
jgi:N-acetylmuramoyl-L-alanine amidase